METDTVTVTAAPTPDWTFDKSAAPATYDTAGDTVTYTYTIANTGNVTLSALTAVDSVEGLVTFTPALVAPGATATATIVHTATQAEVDAGSITNVATATVTFNGTDYSSTDTVTVTAAPTPDWTFDKSAAPATDDTAGDTVTYTYTIANTGNVTLSALTAVDSVEGLVTFTPRSSPRAPPPRPPSSTPPPRRRSTRARSPTSPPPR